MEEKDVTLTPTPTITTNRILPIKLEAEMKEAASHLEFERAALIRDEIRQLREGR